MVGGPLRLATEAHILSLDSGAQFRSFIACVTRLRGDVGEHLRRALEIVGGHAYESKLAKQLATVSLIACRKRRGPPKEVQGGVHVAPLQCADPRRAQPTTGFLAKALRDLVDLPDFLLQPVSLFEVVAGQLIELGRVARLLDQAVCKTSVKLGPHPLGRGAVYRLLQDDVTEGERTV